MGEGCITEPSGPTEPENGEQTSELEQSALFPGAPTVANLNEADILASLSAWARAFGTDRETLRRVLLEREVQPVAERAGHKLYAARHVYKAWSDGTDETDPDKLSPFKRRAWYQGTREKMSLQIDLGKLVAATDVQRTMGRLLQLAVRGFETLQDRIERDAGLSPQQAAVIERHVDQIREELYAEIMSGGSDEEEGEDDAQTSPVAGPPAAAASSSSSDPAPAMPLPPASPPAAASSSSSASSAVDDAIAFLRRSLAVGARPTAELIADGKKVGLSEATLRRAKAQMGAEVIARRHGRGWVWELAQDAQRD